MHHHFNAGVCQSPNKRTQNRSLPSRDEYTSILVLQIGRLGRLPTGRLLRAVPLFIEGVRSRYNIPITRDIRPPIHVPIPLFFLFPLITAVTHLLPDKMMLMRLHLRILSHLLDLNPVIRRDCSNGDKQSGEIDDGEFVVEQQPSGGDGDDFFEDACYGQRYYACSLEESEFGGCHAKGHDSWE